MFRSSFCLRKNNNIKQLLMQPTLVGNLLTLSPVRAEDHDALFQVAKDPEIWTQHPAWDRYKPDVFRNFFIQGVESEGQLVVRENNTNEVIGSTRFYDFEPADDQQRSIAIGYTYLCRRCWGGTYNHEMKKLLLDHSFNYVDRVWFHIGSKNIRSRTAITRVGGVFSHEIDSDPKWGKKDMAYYYIDRNSIKK